jgi:hypothetical protein
VRKLTTIMGARFYLRDNHWGGVFQKLMRDAAIAAVFDGSTVVNQSIILSQLQAMVKRPPADDLQGLRDNLRLFFGSEERLPAFDYGKLVLTYQGREDVTTGLPLAAQALADLMARKAGDADVLERLVASTQELRDRLAHLMAQVRVLESGSVEPFLQQTQLYQAADRFSAMFAASCCLHNWLHNREQRGGWFGEGRWLVMALHRILGQFDPARAPLPRAYSERVAAELQRLWREDLLFSLSEVHLTSHANASRARDVLEQR